MTGSGSAAPRRPGRVVPAAAIVAVVVGLIVVGLAVSRRPADGPPSGTIALSSFGGLSSVPSVASSEGTPAASSSSPAPNSPSPTPSGPTAAPSGPTAVLIGAGDIADCGSKRSAQTAALVEAVPGTVFTAGDNAYEFGSTAQYRDCYDPTWGRFRERTRPAIGNHDTITARGAPYFAYFGAAAGPAPDGWYSYDAGVWHVIVLNSNCGAIGGCGRGSRQLTWLAEDLAAHPVACTLAIWHQPRFSSGEHGDDTAFAPFWQVLIDAHADLVVNGHDHDYERFGPQTASGAPDPVNGIREIVVGTGGKTLRAFNRPVANSEVRSATTYGVLRLDLSPAGYAWKFIATPGSDFVDSGHAACH